jgi:hypothetical protein
MPDIGCGNHASTLTRRWFPRCRYFGVDRVRIAATPVAVVKSKIDLGYVAGSVFWDLLGFADYVLAEKR